MLSKLLGAGRWIATRIRPLALDPHQERRLTDATPSLYWAAGRDFMDWVHRHKLRFDSPEECDDLLVEWKNSPDGLCKCRSPSPNHFAHAVTFVEWVYPQWNSRLPWSHVLHNNWLRFVPMKHTTPCPRFLALVIAEDMMVHNDLREGADLIIAQRKGWRPSETCNIRGGDASLPGVGWDDGVIALGVGGGALDHGGRNPPRWAKMTKWS